MNTKKIELKNTVNSEFLDIIYIPLEKDFIEVATIVEQDNIPYLLELPIQNLVTLLDLTGVIPYELWFFDSEQNFEGKGFSSSSRHGNFRIQTQAKYMLLMKLGSKPSERLKNFQCEKFQFVEE